MEWGQTPEESPVVVLDFDPRVDTAPITGPVFLEVGKPGGKKMTGLRREWEMLVPDFLEGKVGNPRGGMILTQMAEWPKHT